MKRVVVFFAVYFLASAIWSLSFIFMPASGSSEEVIFEVAPGSSFTQVANKLASKGLVRSSFEMRVLAKLTGSESKIRVGEYRLPLNWRPMQVLDVLESGKSIEYSFTIPEGKNMLETVEYIVKAGFGDKQKLLELCRNRHFIKKLLGEELPSLEGYLFPETYKVTKFTTNEEIIGAMVKNFKQNYKRATKEAKIFMPRHEIITLASIIEKETGAPEERPMIASVFHNRLKIKMKLQSDPTILYGIFDETGEWRKNIRKVDILRHTRYNTYTVKALPFGPIANPGYEAIRATLNPVKSEFLYFVSRNNGTHVFSTDYRGHLKAVKDYQLNKKMREGRSWRDLKKTRRK